MPPTIRTFPFGSSVAVCPDRGFSIGVAAVMDPADAGDGAEARNAVAAKAKVIVMAVTTSRRNRFMTVLLKRSDAQEYTRLAHHEYKSLAQGRAFLASCRI